MIEALCYDCHQQRGCEWQLSVFGLVFWNCYQLPNSKNVSVAQSADFIIPISLCFDCVCEDNTCDHTWSARAEWRAKLSDNKVV